MERLVLDMDEPGDKLGSLELDGDGPPAAFPSGTSQLERVDAGPDPRERTRELAELEDKFEKCLAGIAMHFQPIVVASDLTLFAYESLLRSTDRSLPHPGAILDAAEKLERVTKLGRIVRQRVAQVFASAPPARGLVFVNLHALDLFDKALSSPFSPLTKIAHRVVLEITERNSLDDMRDVRYRIAELRELGFRVAVDDLGGGHARMNLLTPLDCDFVKLDMSLVRDCDSHPMKQRLIASIVELCRDQGMKVIGEGVETAAEAATLVSLGTDLLQGYLLGKPGLPWVEVIRPPG
ncbi:MAG: EAL domain-containing protein [Deltaproteobacteria bacterium]|nr:EAL domain-containing protein [Deltaproteobacteria bacterium]